MQFLQENDWYKVIRITGPAHNLLGLSFANEAEDQVVVQPLPVKDGQITRISAEPVRQHVLAGVADANFSLGTYYRVGKIQFVPTDTPPMDIYRSLAKSIVERLARKEAFTQSK
jgi:hypothetical protein